MERKNLIIIGAGGFGRVVYDLLLNDREVERNYALAGFLDTRADLILPPTLNGRILGCPLNHQPQHDEVFLPAIGDPVWRRRLLAPLIHKNAAFYSYIHQASIAARTTIGLGTFIGPGAAVSTDCRIGNYCHIDTYSIIGHDVSIMENCAIGAMCFLAGGVIAEEGATIHPRATIAKDVILGKYCTVGMGSVVTKDVPPNATVFGNPARIIYRADE